MKKVIIIIIISIFCLLGFKVEKVSAMPVGTLLYRTSSDGQLYGLNQKELVSSKKGIMEHIYSGHSAIYVGEINGKDYIVEALAGGLQKTEAKYFIDESQGEKFLGAKIPSSATNLQRQMAAEIALALSEYHFGYDFDFHSQKGPGDEEWTCVGLTEKVYESADINNPYDFSSLNYDNNYAVDITPDGYDDYSTYNSRGDVFSRSKEFSMIKPYTNTIVPAPELLGFNMGRQYKGDRYFFFPYTQFLQDSLEEVELDIDIGSKGTDGIRPSYKALPLALKYTFINQPLSMIKKISSYVKEQKAVAYSADNNNYEIENSGNEVNDKENDEQELSALLKEEASLNKNLDTEGVSNYSDIIQNDNDLNNNKEKGVDDKDLKINNVLEKNIEYNIKDIISADTFVLENDVQVTLASIAVPQLKDKLWQADECQAREAFNFVNKVLSNTTVKLKYGDRASFDSGSRLLAYVYFKDKETNNYILLNNELLKLGLADILDCEKEIFCNLAIHKNLEKSSQYAKDSKLGIFSSSCEEESSGGVNKLSNLGRNLFKGISLKANQIINSIGQVINKPKKESQSEDDLNDSSDTVNSNNNSNINSDNNNNDGSSSDDINNEDNTNNEEDDEIIDDDSEDEPEYNTCIDELLITAVYSTKQDDWIEIYNNCDKDIDLAEANIRLEKAVSVDNPSIIIRFNQVDDYSATDTIIKAHDTYTITRAEAKLNFNVEAVSLRNSFSLGDSGYSIYLAKGPVSDMHDEDIIDLLGYGSSSYFRGARPAPAIDDYYVLRRKADINSNTFNLYPQYDYGIGGVYNSGHNFQDYILLDTGLEPVDDNEDDLDNSDNEDDLDNSDNEDNNNDESNDDNSNEEDDEIIDDDSEDEPEYNTCIDELLITAVYSTLQDDYIEIYNNCNQDVDLFEANIRLEKTVSTDIPSIMIRFNEEGDYSATDTIIKAHETYTIARVEANLNFNAEAVSLRENFSLGDSGYSIYLAKGHVSNPSDEDIIDVLGYGSANYYLGTDPAPAIDYYMLLRRKAEVNSSASTLDVFHDYSLSGIYNTDDNYSNFITIPSGFNDNGEDEFDEGDDEEEENDINIISLWHLDSCFGDYVYDELSGKNVSHNWQWSARESGCVLQVNNREEALELPVSNDVDANNMSILWDYQFKDEYSRMKLELVTVEGDNLILTLSPYYIELTKPGHSKVRYEDFSLPLDNNWHRLAFTTDSLDPSDSSLNIYLDNTILTTITLGQRLYDLSSIKFMSDYNSPNLQIDEIAIFDKPLNEAYLNSLSFKINPYHAPEFVGTLDLKHSWDFSKGQGSIAYDTINSYNLNIDESYWSNGISDYGIELNKSSSEIFSELLIDDNRKSFSLSFWYRNSAYSNEGRGRIMLKQGTDTKLGLKFTPFNSYLYYNHKEMPLSAYEISIPHDDNWHYLALSYDASNYSLKFYLDGIELYSEYKPWLETSFNNMEIIQENWSFQLDEIKIYEGVLSPESIDNTYQQKYY